MSLIITRSCWIASRRSKKCLVIAEFAKLKLANAKSVRIKKSVLMHGLTYAAGCRLEGRRMDDIYSIRKAGREFCQTEGSEHYKTKGKVEPIELIIALGHGEGFCIGSIIKYAARFKETQNLKDLRKISDYAHILAGVKLEEKGDAERESEITLETK